MEGRQERPSERQVVRLWGGDEGQTQEAFRWELVGFGAALRCGVRGWEMGRG